MEFGSLGLHHTDFTPSLSATLTWVLVCCWYCWVWFAVDQGKEKKRKEEMQTLNYTRSGTFGQRRRRLLRHGYVRTSAVSSSDQQATASVRPGLSRYPRCQDTAHASPTSALLSVVWFLVETKKDETCA